MSSVGYAFDGRVERLVDADTLDVALDLGFRIQYRTRLRLHGIDAPERHTDEGKAAVEFVKALLAARGDGVTVLTSKPDKYGRALARVFLSDDTDLGDALVDAGHAVIYTGGTR